MLKEIQLRRSIRKFQDRMVEDETIEQLLRAAMQAPTARNEQSWRFIVIQNRKALEEMVTLQPYMGMMKQASCAILVMGDREANPEDGYLYVDAAASIQNILLEAIHLGLGTCWCAIAPKQERIENFRKYYNLSDRYLPIAAIAVGYSDETKTFDDRFDSSKITWYK